jgi:TolB-like protein/DNA-binding winged helix-turn-helix (wHTH) protein
MLGESRVLRIGDWRVDPELDELSREGRTIRAEPRTMQLLLYLAAHAGRVINVQQLLDAVWSNVVVTHGSVYQAVAELRRILGDDREHPSYIENLPRRGYRLIAPVAPWNAGNSAAPSDSTAVGSSPVTSAPVPAEVQPVCASPDRLAYMGTEAVAAARSLAPGRLRRTAVVGSIALAAAIVAGIALDALWRVHHMPVTGMRVAGKTEVPVTPVTFAPPPHSIAVLPFVNMSGVPSQEYFSDGLTEELLNSLSRINELQVAGRTSSFYFKGEHADLPTIAHKLNVAAVLEGSVRRSGHTIRVTTQLINAVTGFHLWSETYDRDLGDVLKLQREIATAVTSALKVTLLNEEVAKLETGGTRNPSALDAYLRASKSYWSSHDEKGLEAAIATYTEAIRLDPDYALAYAARSFAVLKAEDFASTMSAVRAGIDKARADARKAIALAPNLAEGHVALGGVYDVLLEFTSASEEKERALVLAPSNARALRDYGDFAIRMGRDDSGLTALRRAVTLDPLNPVSYGYLGWGFLTLRRYAEAIAAYKHAEALGEARNGQAGVGWSYYALGDFEGARSVFEKADEDSERWICLAMTYDKLGRHADAEAVLTKLQASSGDATTYQYAEIYAQWGNKAQALNWLENALRLRDPGLGYLKVDWTLDPLRKEPRFQAIERALRFPH